MLICCCFVKTIIGWFNENDGFVSAILSLFTVLAAVLIPVMIAIKQNKIALFEMRLKCYDNLNALIRFCSFVAEYELGGSIEVQGDKKIVPIGSYMNKYFETHDLVSDDKTISEMRTNPFWKDMMITKCLEQDRGAIRKGTLLSNSISLEEADNIGETIDSFVREIFNFEASAIDDKRTDLISKIDNLKKLTDALGKKLRVK